MARLSSVLLQNLILMFTCCAPAISPFMKLVSGSNWAYALDLCRCRCGQMSGRMEALWLMCVKHLAHPFKHVTHRPCYATYRTKCKYSFAQPAWRPKSWQNRQVPANLHGFTVALLYCVKYVHVKEPQFVEVNPELCLNARAPSWWKLCPRGTEICFVQYSPLWPFLVCSVWIETHFPSISSNVPSTKPEESFHPSYYWRVHHWGSSPVPPICRPDAQPVRNQSACLTRLAGCVNAVKSREML